MKSNLQLNTTLNQGHTTN